MPSRTGPYGFTRGELAESRKRVANYLGRETADKCTDALLVGIGRSGRPASRATIVLECADYSSPAGWTKKSYADASRAADAGFEPLRSTMKQAGCHVDTCWLNSCMRATGGTRGIAAVAGDPAVLLLDRPRLLKQEMTVATGTCGVPLLRERLSVAGRGVSVAVIDREASLDHPALAGRIRLQANLSGETTVVPHAHGTAIAGIIGSNAPECEGIAPGVTLLNYKIFPKGDDFTAAQALEQAIEDDAHVANCSWGTPAAVDGTSRETRAVNRAWQLGLVVVKSAGNTGPRRNTMSAPADADGVIVVAASDRAGQVAPDYSSRGPTDNGKHPTLCAPGGTDLDRIVTCLADHAVSRFGPVPRGTSLAAAIVSGAAALLLELDPAATPDTIRQRLVAACRPFAHNDPNVHGAGLLDLRAIAGLLPT